MDILNFMFRLGVMFAIYGFLWGMIELAFRMLTAGRSRSIGEVYVIRAIKYLFLADVTFLTSIDQNNGELNINQLILAGIVLLTYFIGKLQNNQNRLRIFKMMGNRMMNSVTQFNLRGEVIVIALALGTFAAFYFAPQYATNPISVWFHESIINIEDTPFFGFIFKVIGFFFLLSLIVKMLNGLTFVLSGGRANQNDNNFDDFDDNSSRGSGDGEFVEYEEVE